MEKSLGVGNANVEGAHADSSECELWPATTIVTGGSSFTLSFIRASMSPMRLLSTKCDDAPQSNAMVNFSGPGVAEPARNEKPMPDGGDSLAYGVGATSDLTGVGGTVNGEGGAATGAAGAGAMAVREDMPLAVTVMLARPVLEASP